MAKNVGRISRKRMLLRRMAWRRTGMRFSSAFPEGGQACEMISWGRSGEFRKSRRIGATIGSSRSNSRVRWADIDPMWLHGPGLRLGASLFRRDVWPSFAAGDEYFDPTLPCGLRQGEVMDLMYRELKPEDYEVLSKLDEAVPKTDIVQRSLVDGLPQARAADLGADECGVCLAKLDGAELVSKLPCQHAFHPQCIGKWLTQCKNSCPLCSLPIDKAKA
uniref:RING-type E3 ubiquitin transferase n=1 Tax=Zooxanthella nutricula TaxID=1333877 RepID=A0A6U9AJC4_9DINO